MGSSSAAHSSVSMFLRPARTAFWRTCSSMVAEISLATTVPFDPTRFAAWMLWLPAPQAISKTRISGRTSAISMSISVALEKLLTNAYSHSAQPGAAASQVFRSSDVTGPWAISSTNSSRPFKSLYHGHISSPSSTVKPCGMDWRAATGPTVRTQTLHWLRPSRRRNESGGIRTSVSGPSLRFHDFSDHGCYRG